MTIRLSKRLSRRSAERALDRTGASGVPAVDQILSAASAPATNFELNREADTVAMFRKVGPARTAVRRTALQNARARFGAAKLIVAGVTAIGLAGGGVAFAATSGHLPGPFSNSHRSPTGNENHPNAPSKPTKPPKSTFGPGSTAPDPSLKGLCRAYRGAVATNPGKALSNPAFTVLALKAGGRANIAAYCTALLGAPGTKPTHPVHPTHPVKPTDSATPTEPAHPTHPTHPVKPTKSPKPTKKAHPTHPVHPSHSATPTVPSQ